MMTPEEEMIKEAFPEFKLTQYARYRLELPGQVVTLSFTHFKRTLAARLRVESKHPRNVSNGLLIDCKRTAKTWPVLLRRVRKALKSAFAYLARQAKENEAAVKGPSADKELRTWLRGHLSPWTVDADQAAKIQALWKAQAENIDAILRNSLADWAPKPKPGVCAPSPGRCLPAEGKSFLRTSYVPWDLTNSGFKV